MGDNNNVWRGRCVEGVDGVGNGGGRLICVRTELVGFRSAGDVADDNVWLGDGGNVWRGWCVKDVAGVGGRRGRLSRDLFYVGQKLSQE